MGKDYLPSAEVLALSGFKGIFKVSIAIPLMWKSGRICGHALRRLRFCGMKSWNSLRTTYFLHYCTSYPFMGDRRPREAGFVAHSRIIEFITFSLNSSHPVIDLAVSAGGRQEPI